MASKSTSDSSLLDAFQGLSSQIGHATYREQIRPSLLGFGMGNNKRFEESLANSKGPMAGLIKYLRQAAPEIMGDTSQFAHEGLAAINQMAPNYQHMLQQGSDAANQYAQEVQSPIQNQALYQQTMQNVMDAARPGQAARGMLDSGGAGYQEARLARDTGLQFAGQRRQDLASVAPLTQNAASAQLQGIMGLYGAKGGMSQMPLNLAGMLQQLYGSGTQQANALTTATTPQIAQRSMGWGIV